MSIGVPCWLSNHMAQTAWPSFPLPLDRGAVAVQEVMAAPAGPERDGTVDARCASVWDAYRDSHRAVAELLQQHVVGARTTTDYIKMCPARDPFAQGQKELLGQVERFNLNPCSRRASFPASIQA